MSKVNVLIVEDESIVAKDIQLSLKKFGYNVVGTAATAESAIEIALETEPSVILMDIMLKGKTTGIEAAEAIKREINVPIIYLTANTDADTLEKAKISEPHGFIVKPFKEIDLKTAIEMTLYKFDKEIELLKERDLLFSLVENDENRDSFFVKSKSKYMKLKGDDIYYVEALKDYVVINTKDTRYTIHSTMKDISKKLPTDKFIRVHRSFIVRIDKIKYIEYANLVVEEHANKMIPIGGSYKEELEKKLNFF